MFSNGLSKHINNQNNFSLEFTPGQHGIIDYSG